MWCIEQVDPSDKNIREQVLDNAATPWQLSFPPPHVVPQLGAISKASEAMPLMMEVEPLLQKGNDTGYKTASWDKLCDILCHPQRFLAAFLNFLLSLCILLRIVKIGQVHGVCMLSQYLGSGGAIHM
ncbi:hypothetical protein JB92DRAFT_2829998 [Gautieria morchelliformis]|nr:hypothetical protein JB92DRAFT_2829998 [Gautieria morchelliformis]